MRWGWRANSGGLSLGEQDTAKCNTAERGVARRGVWGRGLDEHSLSNVTLMQYLGQQQCGGFNPSSCW